MSPNVLFVVADDHCSNTMPTLENSIIQAVHLDGLIKKVPCLSSLYRPIQSALPTRPRSWLDVLLSATGSSISSAEFTRPCCSGRRPYGRPVLTPDRWAVGTMRVDSRKLTQPLAGLVVNLGVRRSLVTFVPTRIAEWTVFDSQIRNAW